MESRPSSAICHYTRLQMVWETATMCSVLDGRTGGENGTLPVRRRRVRGVGSSLSSCFRRQTGCLWVGLCTRTQSRALRRRGRAWRAAEGGVRCGRGWATGWAWRGGVESAGSGRFAGGSVGNWVWLRQADCAGVAADVIHAEHALQGVRSAWYFPLLLALAASRVVSSAEPFSFSPSRWS